jgi:hypothetical protein
MARPVASFSDAACPFHVRQVVDDIHRAGDHAEQDKGENGSAQQSPVCQLLIENESSEYKDILDPLPGSQCSEQTIDVGEKELHSAHPSTKVRR